MKEIRVTGPLARELELRVKSEEFFNKCHGNDGRFCSGPDGSDSGSGGSKSEPVKLRSVDKKGKSLASKYHEDATDKQGRDYVTGHLTQVGTSLPPELAMAGWLHDAIEDTGATPEDLAKDGIDAETIRTVLAVTTDGPNAPPGTDEKSFPEKMETVIELGGPKAARVKLSDLHSNTDPTRNPGLTISQKRLDGKKQVEDYLREADPVLYKDYEDRILNKPGSFDWSKVEVRKPGRPGVPSRLVVEDD